MLHALKIISHSFRNHLKFVFSERLFFINGIINPLGLSILFYYIHIGQPPRIIALSIVKAGLLGLWGTNIWGASYILLGEKRLGTIDYLLTAPKSMISVILGKSLAVALTSNISVLISFLWVWVLVGPIWEWINLYLLLWHLLAAMISFTSVGLLIGVFFIGFRQLEIMSQLFTYPIYILSGIATPVASFPRFVRLISKSIPLYWVQTGFQTLWYPEGDTSVIYSLSLGVFYFLCGVVVFKLAERRARWTGNFARF